MFSTKTTLSVMSTDFYSAIRHEGVEKVVAQLKEHTLKYGLPQEIFHYGNVYQPIDWLAVLETQAANMFLELRKQIPGFLPEPKDLFPLEGDVLGLGNTHSSAKWINALKASIEGNYTKEEEIKAYIRGALQTSLEQLDKLETPAKKERVVVNAIGLASRTGWDDLKGWMLALPVVKSVINECQNQGMLDLFFRGNERFFSGYDFLLPVQAFMEGGYEKALNRFVRAENGEISKTFIANGFNVFGKKFIEAARKNESLGIKNIIKAIKKEVFLQEGTFYWSTLPRTAEAAKALMECEVPVVNPSELNKGEIERVEECFVYVAAGFELGAIEEYLKNPVFKAALQKNPDTFLTRCFADRPQGAIDKEFAGKIKIAKKFGATLQGKDWGAFKLLDRADLVTPGAGRDSHLRESIEMTQNLGIDLAKDTDLLKEVWYFKGDEGKRALKRLKSHGVIQFNGGAIAKVLFHGVSPTIVKMFALDAGDAVNDLDFQGRPVWWSTHPSNSEIWWKGLNDKGIGVKPESGESLVFFLLSNPYGVSCMNEYEILKRMRMLVKAVDKDVYDFGLSYRDAEGRNIMHLLLRPLGGKSSYYFNDVLRICQNEMGLNDVLLKELLNQKNNKGRTPVETMFDSCSHISKISRDHLPLGLIKDVIQLIDMDQLSDRGRFISEAGEFISKIFGDGEMEKIRMDLEKDLLLMATSTPKNIEKKRIASNKI